MYLAAIGSFTLDGKRRIQEDGCRTMAVARADMSEDDMSHEKLMPNKIPKGETKGTKG